MSKSRDHERGFASGVAVACSIILASGDQPSLVAEVLNATGLDTRAKMKAKGVDAYDLKKLRPAFAELK